MIAARSGRWCTPKATLIEQPVEAVAGMRIRSNGRWVLNFASTNYLGLNQHPRVIDALSRAARIWSVSLGMPRIMATDRLTCQLERAIAKLVRQEQALMFPSTRHIANDVLPLLAGPKGAVFIDQWAYPISQRGAQTAARRGARVFEIPHHDRDRLSRMLPSDSVSCEEGSCL